jgi:hypothetical protein
MRNHAHCSGGEEGMNQRLPSQPQRIELTNPRTAPRNAFCSIVWLGGAVKVLLVPALHLDTAFCLAPDVCA